jgi:ribonuclease E
VTVHEPQAESADEIWVELPEPEPVKETKPRSRRRRGSAKVTGEDSAEPAEAIAEAEVEPLAAEPKFVLVADVPAEPAPEPAPAVLAVENPPAAPREPDPAEISAPPAAPRRGWWRRSV